MVGQIENERNFHIFYQLTKAAPANYKEQYGLQGPESFLYTSKSNCLNVEGISDENDFQDTLVSSCAPDEGSLINIKKILL